MNEGFSHTTTSPSLHITLQQSSTAWLPPVVTMVWSKSRPMQNFSIMRFAIASRKGG